MRRQILVDQGGELREAQGGSLLRRPESVVIGQLQETVGQLGLVQVGRKRADFFVRRYVPPVKKAQARVCCIRTIGEDKAEFFNRVDLPGQFFVQFALFEQLGVAGDFPRFPRAVQQLARYGGD